MSTPGPWVKSQFPLTEESPRWQAEKPTTAVRLREPVPTTEVVEGDLDESVPIQPAEMGKKLGSLPWNVAVAFSELGSEVNLIVTHLPRRRSWQELRATFEDLAIRWREETAMEALPSRKAMNFSYQCIIGMGPDVIPFILESMADEIDDWYWALTAIARRNVAAGTQSMSEAANAWLAWGRAESYIA
jgi:hypothetical protein